MKLDIKKALADLLDTITKAEAEGDVLIMKKVNTEKREITAVVLEPTTPENPDCHNDFYDAAEVNKACDNFNENCMNANIQHLVQVESDACVIKSSWVQPVESQIGDQIVKAGSWLMTMKVNDDTLWEAVKDGVFTGFSIGADGNFEDHV